MSFIRAVGITQQFNDKTAVNQLDLSIDQGRIYSIIGPNGCGKSTLLRILARQLKPKQGEVFLEGENLYKMPPKRAALKLALLAQSAEPVDLTVQQLIAYGRSPHKSMLQKMNKDDDEIIRWAIEQTNLQHLADRNVATLSGGERQRVWIALAIAQQSAVLLLDEPTTFLDVSHQLEVMEVVAGLNRNHGTTIIMVLHDMNHAAAYSDEIIVMNHGRLYSKGAPDEVMTPAMLREVFQVEARIYTDPEDGKPAYLLKGLADKERAGKEYVH
ncbi:ABC transporter ATP-binding protein [Paenibacillus sepulcri]|uniref:ABC transporter ATP-binding protein n=1 Tax=Paenibacillus sepulcri TaxID=359917 RepID=A0ABS7C9S9_9BACL|nr:ABC transporter ATP-binding protein [Paenibacillus sepulcri]